MTDTTTDENELRWSDKQVDDMIADIKLSISRALGTKTNNAVDKELKRMRRLGMAPLPQPAPRAHHKTQVFFLFDH